MRSLRIVSTLAALIFLLPQPAGAEPAARPNIVVAIADDWSWPHAGAYGDKFVKTPAFDRVSREGALFKNAFCASPSCTPSRGSLLTGQAVHRLENGGNLWSLLPEKFKTYPDLLEARGYAVGLTGKGWGPGTLEGSGRKRNPAGPTVKDFDTFLKTVPKDKPFAYWFGSQDPHRPYEAGSGVASGMKRESVVVPPYFPDTPLVRSDILDYGYEVERFDRAVGKILQSLNDAGLSANTIVVVTSDNGMPFPRCKANLYDSGTHMPLALRWPSKIAPGQMVDAFVSLTDLAPTFLEAAGLNPSPEMTGKSLLPLVEAGSGPAKVSARDAVFLERERHANVREANQSYPSRAIRTKKHLYIRNLRHDRWPAGDPILVHSVGPFGDVDGSPTKDLILSRRDDPDMVPFFNRAFGKRPAEELYDLATDPHETRNLAADTEFSQIKAELRARLDGWRSETKDPLANDPGQGREPFDDYPYVGPPEKKPAR